MQMLYSDPVLFVSPTNFINLIKPESTKCLYTRSLSDASHIAQSDKVSS